MHTKMYSETNNSTSRLLYHRFVYDACFKEFVGSGNQIFFKTFLSLMIGRRGAFSESKGGISTPGVCKIRSVVERPSLNGTVKPTFQRGTKR